MSLEEIIGWSKRHINYKLGAVMGLAGGGIVYYINREHGFCPATGGFGKQFLYNMFIAGFNIKSCEKLATHIRNGVASAVSSTIVPTLQAFVITYGIHKLGGTPEAFDSSVWQVYLNIPIFFTLGYYYHNRESYPTTL